MKILIISPKNRTVYNFRGDLIKQLIKKGQVYVTGPNLDDIDKINSLGVEFIEVKMNKTGVNIFNDYKYYCNIRNVIKSINPDLVFTYTIKPNVYGSLASKGSKIVNVFPMVTGVGYTFIAKTFKARILRSIVKILYRISFKYVKKVIFQNPDDLREFVSNRIVSEEKCVLVNGSGINMDKYLPTSLPDNITFFMLSRLIVSKGVNEYIEASKIVKEKYPNVNFMLLGAYEEMPDCIDFQILENLINKGIIQYFKETDDVTEYYSKCSVFVLPSYREGTPRSVLEAMSMKRAIITTNVPGCKETVIDGYNGYLVEPKDVLALVNKMTVFIEKPELIKRMGEKSYLLCKEKYDVNIVNDEMMRIFNI